MKKLIITSVIFTAVIVSLSVVIKIKSNTIAQKDEYIAQLQSELNAESELLQRTLTDLKQIEESAEKTREMLEYRIKEFQDNEKTIKDIADDNPDWANACVPDDVNILLNNICVQTM